jgi:hypothetical protein
MVCCCVICKCKSKQHTSSTTNKGKETVRPNTQKAIAKDTSHVCAKINGIMNGNQQDMLLYAENNTQNISMPPVVSQDKRNPDPDLINDAESLRRNDSDIMLTREENLGALEQCNENKNFTLLPIARYNPSLVHNGRDVYQVFKLIFLPLLA